MVKTHALLLSIWTLLSLTPAAAAVPDNGWVVWASNRQDGRHELYLMRADGTGVKRLTHIGAQMPAWSPDGRWISYRDNRDGTIRVMRHDGAEDHRVFHGRAPVGQPSSVPPFWLPDGSGLVCRDKDSFYVVDPENHTARLLFHKHQYQAVADREFMLTGMTNDSRWLLGFSDRFKSPFMGTNGQFQAVPYAAVLLDTRAPSTIYFFGDGCEPTSAPASDALYHVSRKRHIYTMRLSDLMTRESYAPVAASPDEEYNWNYFPRLSNDGVWLTFGSSRACQSHDTCNYEIFMHQMGALVTERTRLTTDPANDQWPHLFVGEKWHPGRMPRLSVLPSRLEMVQVPGGPPPTPRAVALVNTAAGTLTRATLSVVFDPPEQGGWLALTLSGAGNQQRVTNALRDADLPPGQYRASVVVQVAGATGSPRRYDVDLLVEPVDGSGGCVVGGPTATGLSLMLALLLGLALARSRSRS